MLPVNLCLPTGSFPTGARLSLACGRPELVLGSLRVPRNNTRIVCLLGVEEMEGVVLSRSDVVPSVATGNCGLGDRTVPLARAQGGRLNLVLLQCAAAPKKGRRHALRTTVRVQPGGKVSPRRPVRAEWSELRKEAQQSCLHCGKLPQGCHLTPVS